MTHTTVHPRQEITLDQQLEEAAHHLGDLARRARASTDNPRECP
ncbi:hypothetical protein ACFWDK_08255 [Micromonospora chalcea]